jgi:hypothetical protein
MAKLNIKKNTHVFMSVGCKKSNTHGAFHFDDKKIICDNCGEDITEEFENLFQALKISLAK